MPRTPMSEEAKKAFADKMASLREQRKADPTYTPKPRKATGDYIKIEIHKDGKVKKDKIKIPKDSK